MNISAKTAQNIVEEAHGAIHRGINFMDTGGTIIASSDPARIGHLHSGAMQVLASGLPRLVITEETAAPLRSCWRIRFRQPSSFGCGAAAASLTVRRRVYIAVMADKLLGEKT